MGTASETACPKCGFRYAWDGKQCNHCHFTKPSIPEAVLESLVKLGKNDVDSFMLALKANNPAIEEAFLSTIKERPELVGAATSWVIQSLVNTRRVAALIDILGHHRAHVPTYEKARMLYGVTNTTDNYNRMVQATHHACKLAAEGLREVLERHQTV